MHLVVVESPAKAKTIEGYLGSDYKVIASLGHIRDLPSSEGSVKPDEDFKMIWELGDKGKKQAKTLNEAVKNSESLILATDPDREGEAIAWHVLEVLQEKGSLADKKISRVTFNAITKKEINEAINNPREIDTEMVQAYLARRALDYLVGFTLSPVLWRKLPGARSAGRVQSVALRLICEREIEIESFIPQEYWSVNSHFSYEDNDPFEAKLTHFDSKKLEQFDINNEDRSEEIKLAIQEASFKITDIQEKNVSRKPSPPFITSTLQMEASRKLNMTAKVTMMTAQKLYEAGLITYMRTDGVQIGKESIEEIRSSIGAIYGEDFLPDELRDYQGNIANAQEAHEAIRPTDPKKTPDIVKNELNDDQYGLYSLIWKRTLASQMENWRGMRTTVLINNEDGDISFRASGTVTVFEGFRALYEEGRAEDKEELQNLPKLVKDSSLANIKTNTNQHFTKPPPRFSEPSLVKSLEEKGIGRPSTYASIISVLQDRNYVRLDKRYFYPEDKGRLVTSFLESFFRQYVGYDFTAQLEENLDKVSNGEMNWKDFLNNFWGEFNSCSEKALELRTRDILDQLNESLGNHIFKDDKGEIDRKCPKCEEGILSLKTSRNGAFIGCSAYPDCKYTRTFGSNSNVEPRIIGVHPETNKEINLLVGRYGPYLEIQADDPDTKPKRSTIPKTIDPDEVNLELALNLLSLPKIIGIHPEDGNEIKAGLGRFGPYVVHEGIFASLTNVEELFSIGLNRAIDLIEEKKANPGRGRASKTIKELGKHPKDEKDIVLMEGRYGPFVKHGKVNASIPKDMNLDDVNLELAIELIKNRKKKKKK